MDLTLQENKVTNIRLTCEKIAGITVLPGETFSFWNTIGAPTANRADHFKRTSGFRYRQRNVPDGKPNSLDGIKQPIGCHRTTSSFRCSLSRFRQKSPQRHGHIGLLNYINYHFKNNTNQPVQIFVKIEDGESIGELRTTKEFPYSYHLTEENHHFRKENENYYRISQVYRFVTDKKQESCCAKN